MKEMLYFKVNRSTGYSLQLVVDLTVGKYKRGYCLFAWRDSVTLKTKKDMELLCSMLDELGYARVGD